MSFRQKLNEIFNLQLPANTPGIAIYSDFENQRLNFTCKFIFNHVLGINYSIIKDLNVFETPSSQAKLNYSDKNLPGMFQIKPAGLLSQNHVNEEKPKAFIKDSLPYFFPNDSLLQSDFFSSVFYFVSRYEEWQSFEKDKHGRFEAKASLLYQYQTHTKPLVDIWIMEFKQQLQTFYPQLKFPQKQFKTISTLDVDNLYAYKHKGLIRSWGATLKDVLKFDFKNISERFQVLMGSKPDPFDVYEDVSKFCAENNSPLFWFFLFRNGTQFDRTLNPGSSAFIQVFDSLKKHGGFIGLHPSYYSSEQPHLFNQEMKNFSEKTGQTTQLVRQHFLRYNIKTTPQLMMDNGIVADFTMGYASSSGFRAGTCFPFYYYNFNKECEENLLMIPFCVMDGAYTVYENTSPEKALENMLQLALEIKKVNGFFISVFHERTFSNHLYKGFDSLYKNLHLRLKEL